MSRNPRFPVADEGGTSALVPNRALFQLVSRSRAATAAAAERMARAAMHLAGAQAGIEPDRALSGACVRRGLAFFTVMEGPESVVRYASGVWGEQPDCLDRLVIVSEPVATRMFGPYRLVDVQADPTAAARLLSPVPVDDDKVRQAHELLGRFLDE